MTELTKPRSHFKVRLSYRNLLPFALAYSMLPILIFSITWLKTWLSILLVVLLAAGYAAAVFGERLAKRFPKAAKLLHNPVLPRPIDSLSKSPKEPRTVSISVVGIVVICLITLIWCILGGQGGLWYQNGDWYARNAIYNDLITHKWPVYYNDHKVALAYYIGYWLPPAAVGRALTIAGLSHETVWAIARIALLVWTWLGVTLVAFLTVVTIQIRKTLSMVVLVLMLVFFSTPDILGIKFLRDDVVRYFSPEIIPGWLLPIAHVDGWPNVSGLTIGQYSSNTTCLFWVFNQTVITWVCTLCFLNERSFKNYFLLWLCCAFCGPMPCVGLALLMVFQGLGVVFHAVKRRSRIAPLFADIVSVQNVAAIISAPFLLSYFLGNSAVSAAGPIDIGHNLLASPFWFPADGTYQFVIAAFVVIEGLLIPALIAKHNYAKPLFYGVIASLILCPFVRIGYSIDFCMRASIPALFVLFALTATFIRDQLRISRKVWRQPLTIALAIVLALGTFTPLVEMSTSTYFVLENSLFEATMEGNTLEGLNFATDAANFGNTNPKKTLFFKEFAQ